MTYDDRTRTPYPPMSAEREAQARAQARAQALADARAEAQDDRAAEWWS